MAILVALAQVVASAASTPEPATPDTGLIAEISTHASDADQALTAGHVFLAEHQARLALASAYTLLGRLLIVDSNRHSAEDAWAHATARAPSFALDARALLHGKRASRGELDPALTELRLLTEMAPDHLEARRQLVLALVRGDTLDEASLELEAVRRLDAEAAEALEPWVRRQDLSSAKPGRIAETLIEAGPLARLPAAERERLRRSVTAIIEATEAKLASALARSQTLASVPAESPASELKLAHDALADGKIKRALEHARRALDVAPSSEPLLRFHATVALDAGLTSVAAPSVETLARMDPERGDYAFMVGRVWMQLGKTGEASEALLKAIELDPDLLPARRELGLALHAESRFEPSRQHLERFLAALEDPRQDLEAQSALAEAEERLGDSAAAETRARQVLERNPQHARARLVLGLVLAGRGEFELARAELEKSIAADPKLPQAHYRLSFACTRLGDRECADRHLELYRNALGGPESEVVPMTRVVQDTAPQPASMAPMSEPKSENQLMQGGGG